MQIKYIGKCDKTDSIRGVGLHWQPDQIRNVTPEVAERLLPFTDTWVKIEEEEPGNDQAIGLQVAEKPAEEPLPVVDFHGMDKEALVAFAAREYNEQVDKRLSVTTIRHKVIGFFTKHQANLP